MTRPGPAGARWTWADSHPAAAEALESAATADPSPVVRKKAPWYIPGGAIYRRTHRSARHDP
ncbi:MAG TPA: hypothetical protein VGJ50_29315 [Streptosporangiaceae bacterium]